MDEFKSCGGCLGVDRGGVGDQEGQGIPRTREELEVLRYRVGGAGIRRGRLADTRGMEGGNCRGGHRARGNWGGDAGSSFAAPV